MMEDRVLETFVKGRLEESAEPVSENLVRRLRQAALRQSRRRMWGPPLLAAASVAALLFGGQWLSSPVERPVGDETQIVQAIDLLGAAEGMLASTPTFDASEKLLAWQDAPYMAIQEFSSEW